MAKRQAPRRAYSYPSYTSLRDHFTAGEIISPPVEEDTADTMVNIMLDLEISEDTSGDEVKDLGLPSLFNDKV